MKIIDWRLIAHAVWIWDTVVIQKHISGKKSIWTGVSAKFVGLEDEGEKAVFTIEYDIAPRPMHSDYKNRIYNLASIPLSRDFKVNADDGDGVWFPIWRSIDTLWDESPATEFTQQIGDFTSDRICKKVSIHLDTFAFVQQSEYYDFLHRHKVESRIASSEYIGENNEFSTLFPGASHATNLNHQDYLWFKRSIIKPTTIVTCTDHDIRRRICIAEYHSIVSEQAHFRSVLWAYAYPIVIDTKTRWTQLGIDALKIATQNAPAEDEVMFEVWQAVNIPYVKDEISGSGFLQLRSFLVGVNEVTAKEEIIYIDFAWDRHLLVVPIVEASAESPRRWFSTFTYDMADSMSTSDVLSTADLLRAVTNGSSVTFQIPRNQSRTTIWQPSEPQKFNIGDIVYLNQQNINAWKAYRKNREYVVNSYFWTNSYGKQVYWVQPANKKSINWWDGTLQLDEWMFYKAEKVTKRKFVLAADFGKYKKGQIFTRDEMVSIFGKFQDARDPYILNKLYICAE